MPMRLPRIMRSPVTVRRGRGRSWRGAPGAAIAAAVLAAAFAPGAQAAGPAGDLDADVLLRSGPHRGAVAGILHGNVSRGRGFVAITPAARGSRAGFLWLRARRDGAGAWRLSGRGAGSARLTLRLRGRHLTGRGVAPGGRRVRVRGYGGVARRDAGRGRLLVVGSRMPAEVRGALGRSYRLVAARPARLARARVLASPRALSGVAGVVVGARSGLGRLARNGALRTLADGHRWVMVAGATNARLAAVKAAGLPVPRLRRTAPLVAMRRNGTRGSADGVRSVVVYPGRPESHMTQRFAGQEPQRLKMTYPAELTEGARRARMAFLVRALRRHGVAYAVPRGAARASQSPGSLTDDCTTAQQASGSGAPPAGVSSCYQIYVNSFASQPFGPSANMSAFCGTYQNLDSTFGNNLAPGYCPYTWQGAGLPSGSYPENPPPPNPPPSGQGAPYWGVDYPVYFNACTSWWTNSSQQSNVIQSSFGNQDNPFNAGQMLSTSVFNWNWLGSIVFESNIDSYTECPTQSWQPAQFEVEDTYFALYEPTPNQQGILAVTNSEITPADPSVAPYSYTPEQPSAPIVTISSNGKYSNRADGGAANAPIPETCCLLGQDVVTMQYQPPGNATGQSQIFTIDNTNSFPVDTISTGQSQTTSSSTEGWNVGLSVSQTPGVTGGWTDTTQYSNALTINVPDWQVVPEDATQPDGDSQITYTWSAQTPVDYAAAYECGPCPNPGYGASAWGQNTQMVSSWNPNSQTAWTSEPDEVPGGTPLAGIEHDFSMLDYYTAWSAGATTIDKSPGWRVWLWADGDWSYTSGVSLDLCDPIVLPSSGTAPLC